MGIVDGHRIINNGTYVIVSPSLPNPSHPQVDQYMASLPKESVPLKGSNGEIDRLRRFHRQLPPYDWNPEACHKLSELESKRFLKLAEKRRRTAYGVGSVEVDQAEKVCEWYNYV